MPACAQLGKIDLFIQGQAMHNLQGQAITIGYAQVVEDS